MCTCSGPLGPAVWGVGVRMDMDLSGLSTGPRGDWNGAMNVAINRFIDRRG